MAEGYTVARCVSPPVGLAAGARQGLSVRVLVLDVVLDESGEPIMV